MSWDGSSRKMAGMWPRVLALLPLTAVAGCCCPPRYCESKVVPPRQAAPAAVPPMSPIQLWSLTVGEGMRRAHPQPLSPLLEPFGMLPETPRQAGSPPPKCGGRVDGGALPPLAPGGNGVPAKPGPTTAEVPCWAKVAPEQLDAAKKAGVPVAFENSIGMRFVLIPAGTFTMGSPEGEKGRERDEAQHRVTLTQPFYMSMCETTNEEFRRYEPGHQSPTFMGESLGEERLPVVNVESGDAVAFAGWLSLREANWTYRLPTEAEWEYSARAGTGTRWDSGSDTTGLAATANISDLRAKKMFHMGWAASWDDGYAMAAPVGSFAPNPWGLYDTIGNVWELCADWFAPYSSEPTIDPSGPASGSARVVRGGSWWLSPVQARVAYRGAIPGGGPGAWRSICGFRLVASRRSPR